MTVLASAANGQAADSADRLQAVRDVTEGIVEQFPRSYWLACSRERRAPTEMWTAMADAGLLGLGVPEEYGGSGGGVRDLVVLTETLGRAGVPVGLTIIVAFSRVPILKYGTAEQVARYVVPTTTGALKICFAVTEPDAGTNTFKIRTSAQRDGNGWRLSGQKVFISSADEADSMLVVARTGAATDENRLSGLSLFIIDANSPGLERQRMNIGIVKVNSQFQVFFDDVFIPEDGLIGEEGRGVNYLFDGLNPERLLGAAEAIGLGDFVLEKAVEYGKTRAPFGQPIGAYQGLQHPMARAKAHLEAARLMVHTAADRFDRGERIGPEANMAKLLASEAADAAADIAIQVHGGYAFDEDYDIITTWPLIRLLRVAPLNNEMVLNYIGEHVLGLPKSY